MLDIIVHTIIQAICLVGCIAIHIYAWHTIRKRLREYKGGAYPNLQREGMLVYTSFMVGIASIVSLIILLTHCFS